MLQRPRTDTRRRIILGPGLTTRAATCKSPGKKRTSRQKMATSTTIGTTLLPPGKELDDWEEEIDLETYLAGESHWIHRVLLDSDTLDSCDLLDSNTLDSYVEEECSADQNLYEAYLGYEEARDTFNQVMRGRGFWPEIAIPAPDGRSATLAVRSGDDALRGKGKDSKNTSNSTINKGKSKRDKGGKSSQRWQGGQKSKSGKSTFKCMGDPLIQRLVCRTQCRLCGEEGHWEEGYPQADVDMPQAKRRVTFSRPPVGVGVSQAWGVETWTVSQVVDRSGNPRMHEPHGCHHDYA